jgi:hypothetical protein
MKSKYMFAGVLAAALVAIIPLQVFAVGTDITFTIGYLNSGPTNLSSVVLAKNNSVIEVTGSNFPVPEAVAVPDTNASTVYYGPVPTFTYNGGDPTVSTSSQPIGGAAGTPISFATYLEFTSSAGVVYSYGDPSRSSIITGCTPYSASIGNASNPSQGGNYYYQPYGAAQGSISTWSTPPSQPFSYDIPLANILLHHTFGIADPLPAGTYTVACHDYYNHVQSNSVPFTLTQATVDAVKAAYIQQAEATPPGTYNGVNTAGALGALSGNTGNTAGEMTIGGIPIDPDLGPSQYTINIGSLSFPVDPTKSDVELKTSGLIVNLPDGVYPLTVSYTNNPSSVSTQWGVGIQGKAIVSVNQPLSPSCLNTTNPSTGAGMISCKIPFAKYCSNTTGQVSCTVPNYTVPYCGAVNSGVVTCTSIPTAGTVSAPSSSLAPVITLTATPLTGPAPLSSTLSWSVNSCASDGTCSCSWSGGLNGNAKLPSGTWPVSLGSAAYTTDTSESYGLTCKNLYGSSSQSVTLDATVPSSPSTTPSVCPNNADCANPTPPLTTTPTGPTTSSNPVTTSATVQASAQSFLNLATNLLTSAEAPGVSSNLQQLEITLATQAIQLAEQILNGN